MIKYRGIIPAYVAVRPGLNPEAHKIFRSIFHSLPLHIYFSEQLVQKRNWCKIIFSSSPSRNLRPNYAKDFCLSAHLSSGRRSPDLVSSSTKNCSSSALLVIVGKMESRWFDFSAKWRGTFQMWASHLRRASAQLMIARTRWMLLHSWEMSFLPLQLLNLSRANNARKRRINLFILPW